MFMLVFFPQMQMPNARPNQEMAAPQPWGPPQSFPMNAGGLGFRPTQYMPPQHQFDNYYPPPMDKQPRQPPPSYGRDQPVGPAPTATTQPLQSIVTKVLLLSSTYVLSDEF